MNIKGIIQKDEPTFSGICVREGNIPLEKVREFGLSMAWTFNRWRAQSCKKVLVAGHGTDKGKYFVATIQKILSVRELIEAQNEKWQVVIDYHNQTFDNWIDYWRNQPRKNNPVDDRYVIIFEENEKREIKPFSADFAFSRGSFYYVQANNIGEIIEIENIAKITSAHIKLSGLTLIAGVNRTGKSTIGKTIFSIIKGASQSQDNAQFHNPELFKKIEKLYFGLRQRYDLSKNDGVNQAFKPLEFLKEIERKNREDIEISFKNRENLLTRLNDSAAKELYPILEEIKKLAVPKENELLEKCLNDVFAREFQQELSPKNNANHTKSSIQYKAGVNTLLNIEIAQNKIIHANLVEEGLTFKDVIYIETPLVLQLYQLVKAANISHITLHITDLMEKIERAKYNIEQLGDREEDTVAQKIMEIIEGGFVFDEDNSDFRFEQKAGNISIKPTNTASGIKSFGIIQLLLQANILNDSTLLIIDEPENHLHPEWQVRYAEMIIALIKNEIGVIINSHSPYMIQALKYYSEKENVQHKLSYYFAELEGEGERASVRDVSKDLNVIFSRLSKPLTQLVWQ